MNKWIEKSKSSTLFLYIRWKIKTHLLLHQGYRTLVHQDMHQLMESMFGCEAFDDFLQVGGGPLGVRFWVPTAEVLWIPPPKAWFFRASLPLVSLKTGYETPHFWRGVGWQAVSVRFFMWRLGGVDERKTPVLAEVFWCWKIQAGMDYPPWKWAFCPKRNGLSSNIICRANMLVLGRIRITERM